MDSNESLSEPAAYKTEILFDGYVKTALVNAGAVFYNVYLQYAKKFCTLQLHNF